MENGEWKMVLFGWFRLRLAAVGKAKIKNGEWKIVNRK
jgi:hypothetical protein